MTTLWGGRFSGRLDPAAWALNASISFDRRLAMQDVRGSLAWASALEQTGVLTAEELALIRGGLEAIMDEFQADNFEFKNSDEDIHTAVERHLVELIGALAGKLHTGRSRNDQVATDLRLWLMDGIPVLQKFLDDMQQTLVRRAESDLALLMPGYTHLQRAQPILLSHWWLSHFWPLHRDRQRLAQLGQRAAILPLGSAALAGTHLPVDRQALTQDLGFLQPAPNSLDAVSDRDFAAEFLFWAALCGVHLSHLAEAVVIFSSSEFGFFELSDAYSTGSSLMPQKKNPDIFELARGTAGSLIGNLTGLLSTLKGLPSAYDKDLQEDKLAVFQAFDTLVALLPVLSSALQTLTVDGEKMRLAIDPSLMATDLADYLVEKGVPFRQAHVLVGQAVQLASQRNVQLDALPMDTYQALSPAFEADLYQVFDPWESVNRHTALGGTSPQAVLVQIEQAKQTLLG